MLHGFKSIRRERASLERDRVVMTAMLEDATVADLLESTDTVMEGVSDDEIEDLIAKIPESEDDDEQVDRILDSDEGLDVDGILGVETDDANLDEE